MWKKILATVFLVLLISVAIVQAMGTNQKTETGQDESLGGLKIGLEAPDFELETLEGKVVKLSDYKGQKVLLNFWATWCPPCKKEMPDIQEYAEEAGDDVMILAVNMDPENDVQTFVTDMGLTFPILLDHQSVKKAISDRYQVLTIPTSFFIDGDGIIQNKYMGPMTKKYIQQNISNIK